MERNYVYLIVFLFLTIPFVFRAIESKMEPYPAIVLPSGASKLDLNETLIRFQGRDVLAYDYSNNLVKIDPVKFMGEINSRYLLYVAKYNFGLARMSDTISVNKGPFQFEFVQNSKSSIEDIKETKQWIRTKLNEQNLKDSLIIVREYETVYDRISNRELTKESKDETIIELF